jgi:hypothetical protein
MALLGFGLRLTGRCELSFPALDLLLDDFPYEFGATVLPSNSVDPLGHALRQPNGNHLQIERRPSHSPATIRYRKFRQIGLHKRYRLLTAKLITDIAYPINPAQARWESEMKVTAQFDNAKHAVSLEYDRKLMGVRYATNAEHVAEFYMRKRAEFSQMRHVVGSDRHYDAVVSDA